MTKQTTIVVTGALRVKALLLPACFCKPENFNKLIQQSSMNKQREDKRIFHLNALICQPLKCD